MILAGKSVTTANDRLQKVSIDYLYNALKKPKASIVAQIGQLRKIKQLDANLYRDLKKQLPYLVCGIFNPPVRRKENFAYIEYFMLDVDHLSDKGIGLDAVREQLKQDSRLMMMFVSPSEDGLKLLFRLKERLDDEGKYSVFYKEFAKQFNMQYGLNQAVDPRTSDVTRACFLCYDYDVYYNPDAEVVDVGKWVDFENVFDTQALIRDQKKDDKVFDSSIAPQDKQDIDEVALASIRALLNPKLAAKQKQRQEVYVPAELHEMVQKVVDAAAEMNIETTEVINISYGKKFRFKLGSRLGEINLFFGKRGFTVVKSPRAGTCADLNDVTASIVELAVSEGYNTNEDD